MMTASFGLMSCDDNDNATDEVKTPGTSSRGYSLNPKIVEVRDDPSATHFQEYIDGIFEDVEEGEFDIDDDIIL